LVLIDENLQDGKVILLPGLRLGMMHFCLGRAFINKLEIRDCNYYIKWKLCGISMTYFNGSYTY